jgi:hypothetical protein
VSQEPKGRKLKQIFRLLLNSCFAQSLDSIASDYKSTLISKADLLQKESQRLYDVQYEDEYGDEYPRDARIFQVKVTLTGKVSISACLDYLSSTSGSAVFRSKPEVLHTLNIVLGHYCKTSGEIASVSANRHFNIGPNAAERFNLGAGLEVLRGFFMSVRAATSRFLINCQVDYTVCYQEANLSTIITEYRRESSSTVYELEKFVRKLRVRVTHIRRVNKKGQDIPRFKMITGFASSADGRCLGHPPIVSKRGAGPKDVQFWLDGAGPKTIDKTKFKDKKSAKCGPDEPGRYITVENFFLESKFASGLSRP